MIKASDAIRIARSLIGTPYSELDCINLIKKVIRTAPGGVEGYTTAGTNALWKSINSAKKYRDIIWRQEGIFGARAGMLAFKRSGTDVHHVGIVTGEGTVIHSSSVYGKAVETALDGSWQLLATHRYIEVEESAETEEIMSVLYKARVATKEDPLNVRQVPVTGKKIGEIPKGGIVDVCTTGDWVRIKYGDMMGYVASEYLVRIDEKDLPENNIITANGIPVIVDGEGNEFFPVGGWHVEFRRGD